MVQMQRKSPAVCHRSSLKLLWLDFTCRQINKADASKRRGNIPEALCYLDKALSKLNQKQRLHFGQTNSQGQAKSQELQTKVHQGWSYFTSTSFFAAHEIFRVQPVGANNSDEVPRMFQNFLQRRGEQWWTRRRKKIKKFHEQFFFRRDRWRYWKMVEWHISRCRCQSHQPICSLQESKHLVVSALLLWWKSEQCKKRVRMPASALSSSSWLIAFTSRFVIAHEFHGNYLKFWDNIQKSRYIIHWQRKRVIFVWLRPSWCRVLLKHLDHMQAQKAARKS